LVELLREAEKVVSVTQTTAAATGAPAAPEAAPTPAPPLGRVAELVMRSLGPVVLALGAGAILLAALGRNPASFYQDIIEGGIEYTAWQDSIMRMAPLLLIAVGLIVVFRAGIWNLGIDGQFLLAAVVVSGVAPEIVGHVPNWLVWLASFLLAAVVGAAWTIVPALLKARYHLNEIITTLMMTFIGINFANILVKGPFQDFSSNVAQTSTLDFEDLLPTIPGTRVHVGILVAGVAALAVWFLMSRTSFGLRLQVLGANARAAAHIGIDVPRLVVVSFVVSGLFVGLAAAAEILGIWGYVRADWNPAFGLWVVPLVFLARLNALAVIPFVFFLSVLSIGGDFATQQAELSNEFTLVLVGLILLFMGVTELLGRRRELGRSYMATASHRRSEGTEP
jgi:simple sugar transport system permease protein